MTSVYYQPQKHVLLGEIKDLRDKQDSKLLLIIANANFLKSFDNMENPVIYKNRESLVNKTGFQVFPKKLTISSLI